tara:strand:+ start:41123 stop:41248 length:126 start_codon:yes stop_codon:yes gene_type:complete
MQFFSAPPAGKNEPDRPWRKAYAVRGGKVNPAAGPGYAYID